MIDASERLFVDTNILVYAHDSSAAEKQARARDIAMELWASGKGCVSVQVLQEFYVAVTKKVPRPLPWPEAQKIVRDLAAWTVHSPSAEDVVRAIEIQQASGVSFWDAMIIRSASQLKCVAILSEDLSPDRAHEGMRVVNPFA